MKIINEKTILTLIVIMLFVIVITIVSLTLIIAVVVAQESNLQANVNVLGNISQPFITIYSPISDITYSKRSILLNVTAMEKVKELSFSINNGKFSRLCTNCQTYSKKKSFAEGANFVVVKAQTYSGINYTNNVSFRVDSKAPRVNTLFPSKYTNGSFSVKYTELNPVTVNLYYGLDKNNLNNKKELDNCGYGLKVWCNSTYNLNDYDKKYIYYKFSIDDTFREKNSSVKKIFVNVSSPVSLIGNVEEVNDPLADLIDFFDSLINPNED